MENTNLSPWQHSHTFKQDQKRPGESRTLIVIILTAAMMVVEIVAGIVYGSMALLADGLHMASHTIALGIAYFAYGYARKHANNPQFNFGTGKVNTLAGYSGAILLAGFAFLMVWESIHRLLAPVSISFNQAILVAFAGLLVNGVSVFILGIHSHDHEHEHEHHDHTDHHHEDEQHSHEHEHKETDDHNLRSAYLHVLADALTSVLAIIALVVGKYFGASWLDPIIGLVGAVLIARWSWGLLKSTSAILLDAQGPEKTRTKIVDVLESHNCKVVDLHLWSTGPNIYCAIISLVSAEPQTPAFYKELIATQTDIEHITVEVHSSQSP